MKGNNTNASFFWPIFKETWQTFVALCGAIFLYIENCLKNVKNEKKQYICQLFLANFQGNLENVRGAMWRYFFVPRKTAKKPSKMKGNNTYVNFFWPIFKRTWKTFVALCGAIFFVPRKTAKKRQKWKETIHMPTFFGQFSKEPGKRSWRYVALFFCTSKNG